MISCIRTPPNDVTCDCQMSINYSASDIITQASFDRISNSQNFHKERWVNIFKSLYSGVDKYFRDY